MAGRAGAAEAIVPDLHGVAVIPGAGELAGVEMSLAGEFGRERFLHDALAGRVPARGAERPRQAAPADRGGARARPERDPAQEVAGYVVCRAEHRSAY